MAYYDYNLVLIGPDNSDPNVQSLIASGKRFKMRMVEAHGDYVQLSPAEETARDTTELQNSIDALPEKIKNEGLKRINSVFPAITALDDIKFYAEFWSSIAPAARQATVTFQTVIDIYQAAEAAIQVVQTFTTQAEVDAYDVTAAPNWP